MAVYATQADMVAEFGEREAVQLTDLGNTGAIDAARLTEALQKASLTIDSYLLARYSLPLQGSFPLLTVYCCDIARYRLCGSEVTETEAIRNRYKDALAFLTKVNKGEIQLGPDAAGQAAPESARVSAVGGDRIFTRETLADFTGG